MNRRKRILRVLGYVGAIFLILGAGFPIQFSHAQSSGDNLDAPENFKINYHEPLVYRFESPTAIASNPTPGSLAPAEQKVEEVLIFQAFGKQYKLLLRPNTDLVENLPQKQKADVVKGLQIFAGVIEGNDESWVRISREGESISGMFWDGAELYVIENSSQISDALPDDASPQQNYQLIYRLSDTEADHQRCALDPTATPLNDYSGLVDELRGRLQSSPQAAMRLDIAVVADSQFVDINNNTDAAVISRMNVVDGIYSEQVGVHLRISEIRSLQNNTGLTSTNPGTLLDQFGRFSSAPGFNNPGLAHLFTGRNLSGSTIGIAYIASLCSDRFGVGISQVSGSGALGALTVAHEIGHNFGAPHDNQSGSPCASTAGGFIMNPVLNGADQFSQCSLSQMQPNIRNAACISDINPAPDADVGIAFPVNPIATKVDEAFDYKVEIKNGGAAAAANVFVKVGLPNAINIQSASVNGGTCANDSGGVDCDLNNIRPGVTKTINIRLIATQKGRFTSAVEVTADNDSNPGNNNASATINVRDIGNNGLIDANFDTNTDRFVYVDDAFRNTNQPAYARGRYRAGSGFNGGGLQVLLGGRDNRDINGISGGWQRDFQLLRPAELKLSLRIKLSQSRNYEANEISEALAAIDGALLSRNRNGHLLRIRGDGNGGSTITSGWRKFSIRTGRLDAGQHTLVLGGFNNKKTFRNEISEILIDEVVLTETTQTDPNIPTAQCPDPARFASNGQDRDFCWFENLSVPADAKPYCDYLDSHQTIGYSFDIKQAAVCPPGARAATNGSTLNFCLFENLPVTSAANAECAGLQSDGRIGFSFPRP